MQIKEKLKILYKAKFLAIFLFILTLVFRFYRLKELFPFTMDEEYQSFLIKNIIENKHIPLIGVNIAGTGLYLGPFFTWFSVIPLYLSNLNPLSTAFLAAFISAITTVALFYTARILTRNKLTAFLAGFFYLLNPLVNFYDRKYWNPTFIPLLTVLWLFSLIKIKQKKTQYLPLIFLIFGLGLHTHISILILIIPTMWYLNTYCHFLKVKPKYKLLSFLVLLICVAPLIAFELRHNFLQFKSLFAFMIKPNYTYSTQSLSQKFGILLQTISSYLYFGWGRDLAIPIPSHSIFLLAISLLITFSILLWLWLHKVKRQHFTELVFITFVSIFLIMPFYKGDFSIYYFLFLLPLLSIAFALFTSALLYKKTRSTFLLYIFVFLIWTTQTLTLQNHLGLKNKENLFKQLNSHLSNKNYHLEVWGENKYQGYRYLSQLYGLKPVSSYMDTHFSWLYGKVENQADFELIIFDQFDQQAPEFYQQLQKKNEEVEPYLKTEIYPYYVTIYPNEKE
jgi:4-amino-4-deoxy-L-arabinose transferase-like glycosyltransferase